MQVNGWLSNLSNKFWNENFWLPANTTWKDVEGIYPPVTDLFYCGPVVILVLLFKVVLRKVVMVPLARANGIKINEKKRLQPNPILEIAYNKNKNILKNPSLIKKLSLELKWDERKLERWLRKREEIEKGGKFTRLNESGWRFAFSVFLSGTALYALHKEGVLANFDSFMENNFCHKIGTSLWFYAILETSNHLSLFLTQFTDVRRKDYIEMFIHHICAIFLLMIGFFTNMFRLAAVIGICHHVTDIPFEFAKLMKYLNKTTLRNISLVIFVTTWIICRLGFYPFKIISTFYENCYKIFPKTMMCYLVLIPLYIVLVLHIIWTWMIIKALRQFLSEGKLEDVRSEFEDSDDEPERKND